MSLDFTPITGAPAELDRRLRQYRADCIRRRVHEQAHRRDEGRQRAQDRPRRRGRDIARAGLVEVEAERMRAGANRRQCVFEPGNAADFYCRCHSLFALYHFLKPRARCGREVPARVVLHRGEIQAGCLESRCSPGAM